MLDIHYMIHTCKQREWYVDKYLVPSMIEQGIDPNCITIWVDREGYGNLESYMQSFNNIPITHSCWHIEDDVLLTSNFYSITREYNDFNGIVTGFCSTYDKDRKDFYNEESDDLSKLWFSFPCIKLPNLLCKSLAYYYFNTDSDTYLNQFKEKKRGADTIFRRYLKKYYKGMKFINLNPNLVEHVDWLLNGSTAEGKNNFRATSIYFPEQELVEKLEEELLKEKNINIL